MLSKTIILISFNQSNANLKHKYTEILNFNFYMGAVPTQTQSPDYCGKYLNWAYAVYIQNNWFPGVINITEVSHSQKRNTGLLISEGVLN